MTSHIAVFVIGSGRVRAERNFNLIAKEMNISIQNLEINITGNINPEKLLGISDKERAGFKSLNIQLNIKSDASKQVIQELVNKVKERCPVNDNLANMTPVNYSI